MKRIFPGLALVVSFTAAARVTQVDAAKSLRPFTFSGFGESRGLFRVYEWDGTVRAQLPWPAHELSVPYAALGSPSGPHRIALDMDGVRWRLRVDEQSDEDWLTEPLVVATSEDLPPLEKLPSPPDATPVMRPIQYWSPSDWNAWVGDVVAANWKGRLHIFYLFDRRHHANKNGRGGHYFAHLSSADLRQWDEHPAAVFPEDTREYIGTGMPIIAEDGSLILCYGLHTGRHDAEKVNGFPRGGTYATSQDGILFAKLGRTFTDDENPSPWRRTDGLIGLIHSGFSKDCGAWSAPTLNGPWTKVDDTIPTSGDCPCPFEWDGWHYVIQGFVTMAASSSGHPGTYEDWVLSGEDLYDGLNVPMVVTWNGDRRLLVGWINGVKDGASGSEPEEMWGGWLCFRELIRFPDGRLGTKWPKETMPRERPLECLCEPDRTLDVVFRNEKGTSLHFQVFPQEGRAQFSDDGSRRRTLSEEAQLAAVNLRTENRWGRSWELRRLRCDIPSHGANYAIGKIRGLDCLFKVRLIVHYDAKSDVTVFDAEIAGTRTMLARRRGKFSVVEFKGALPVKYL